MVDTMTNRAATVLRKAGIRDERGLTTHEGTSGFTVGEVLADVVPGVELLRGKSRLIVVVTDQNIYLFKGRTLGRIGDRITSFPTSDDVMAFDDRHVIFPDGNTVQMTEHQARELIAATGGHLNYVRANYALRRLGVTNESGLGTAHGIEPSTERRTVAGRLAPVIDVTDYVDASKAEQRILLLSDKHVRLFEGQSVAAMGRELGTFPIGSSLEVDDDTVTFPNGEVVRFASSGAAQKVAEVTRTGQA